MHVHRSRLGIAVLTVAALAGCGPFDDAPSGPLAEPVRLTFGYGPPNVPIVPPPVSPAIFKVVNGVWVEVPGSQVDSVANTVTVSLISFSTYAVFDKE